MYNGLGGTLLEEKLYNHLLLFEFYLYILCNSCKCMVLTERKITMLHCTYPPLFLSFPTFLYQQRQKLVWNNFSIIFRNDFHQITQKKMIQIKFKNQICAQILILSLQ